MFFEVIDMLEWRLGLKPKLIREGLSVQTAVLQSSAVDSLCQNAWSELRESSYIVGFCVAWFLFSEKSVTLSFLREQTSHRTNPRRRASNNRMSLHKRQLKSCGYRGQSLGVKFRLVVGAKSHTALSPRSSFILQIDQWLLSPFSIFLDELQRGSRNLRSGFLCNESFSWDLVDQKRHFLSPYQPLMNGPMTCLWTRSTSCWA